MEGTSIISIRHVYLSFVSVISICRVHLACEGVREAGKEGVREAGLNSKSNEPALNDGELN